MGLHGFPVSSNTLFGPQLLKATNCVTQEARPNHHGCGKLHSTLQAVRSDETELVEAHLNGSDAHSHATLCRIYLEFTRSPSPILKNDSLHCQIVSRGCGPWSSSLCSWFQWLSGSIPWNKAVNCATISSNTLCNLVAWQNFIWESQNNSTLLAWNVGAWHYHSQTGENGRKNEPLNNVLDFYIDTNNSLPYTRTHLYTYHCVFLSSISPHAHRYTRGP